MESFKTEHAVGIPMSSITHVGEELARESASASESVVSFRGSNSHGPFNSKQSNNQFSSSHHIYSSIMYFKQV